MKVQAYFSQIGVKVVQNVLLKTSTEIIVKSAGKYEAAELMMMSIINDQKPGQN